MTAPAPWTPWTVTSPDFVPRPARAQAEDAITAAAETVLKYGGHPDEIAVAKAVFRIQDNRKDFAHV